MLSRRQLRIKVLQSLYSYFQSGTGEMKIAENELFRSIDKILELYYLLMLFITELGHDDLLDSEDLQRKYFPKDEEVHAKNRLHSVRLIDALEKSDAFKSKVNEYHCSWQTDQDLVRKIFLELKKSEEYKKFMTSEPVDEKELLLQIVRVFIEKSEAMQSTLQERSIYWGEDLSFCCHLIIKTIKEFYDQNKLNFPSLYKDEKDDKEFVRLLFEKTILNNATFETSISAKTKNWDVERIAMMDILLMKMALAEMMTFESSPVKVSINEYIDISKEYSTPKSKLFINGIIDKLATEYKADGRIVKTGRGLVE
ncbi:MAG: transcription antitermination protein NusB [Bacteroidetes bacterium]|nr:transcription antitermination protein NusB [Bacteroidota bacterium]